MSDNQREAKTEQEGENQVAEASEIDINDENQNEVAEDKEAKASEINGNASGIDINGENQNEVAEDKEKTSEAKASEVNGKASGEEQKEGKKLTYKEKFAFTTPMNDPDLAMGPYKPTEGEPPTIKCPNCGEEMPTTIDTCVNCGHYLRQEDKHYKPISEAKAKKIRWIVGIICIIAFLIWFIVFKTT